MDYGALKRDKEKVMSAIRFEGKKMIANKDLKIVFPCRYEETKLAVIIDVVSTLGIFAIIHDGCYAVNRLLARVQLTPTEINKVKYQGTDYYELEFLAGETITENTDVLKESTIGYDIYNNFIALGKIPWFMGPDDVLRLFEDSLEDTGEAYGSTPTIFEMIACTIMRSRTDPRVFWRQSVKSHQDALDNPPDYISLKNVSLGAQNTVSKLVGAYFKEGLTSALLYPSDKENVVETLLRQ